MAKNKTQTLGHYLVHSTLPSGYSYGNDTVDKKSMMSGLVDLATKEPDKFVAAVTDLKKIGDDVATYEGISVGLDDISPDYGKRDPILKKYHDQIRKTTSTAKKREILLKAQDELLAVAKTHGGDMGLQARSGGRGDNAQLMKTVATPLTSQDWDENIIPWMVKRSYAEGLKPSELWVTAGEARKNAIMGVSSVVEPGELSKLVVHTMYDQVVSMEDCGTHNGLLEKSFSSHVIDRYLAKPAAGFPRNTLITPQVADKFNDLKMSITVRSPLTCEAKDGVCSKCYGLNSYGNGVKIGTNLGVQSAHAISEPLTQAMLSSKHAAGVAATNTKELRGFSGVKSLMKIPATFANAAVLANRPGEVTGIKDAPQGGRYVTVGTSKHYVPPDQDVIVSQGTNLEAGDSLSTGIPKPNEIMQYKGLGKGRKYYTDTLYDVFKKTIRPMDRRHFEMLAKAQLSHATVDEDSTGGLMRGEVVNYNRLKDRLQENTQSMDLKDSKGYTLSDHYYEYMAGTKVTPTAIKELEERGVTKVTVTKDAPEISFLMKPITHAPLLHPDWMSRLAHQYLNKTIKDAASFGEVSNIHGYHPIPAFVHGTEFGAGSKGAY